MLNLVHENGTFHTRRQSELFYDAAHFLRCYSVKVHILFRQIRYDTRTIQNNHAFQQCSSENLVLHIRFFVESLIYDFLAVKSFSEELSCHDHGMFRCAAILKYTCIMNNSCIQCFRRIYGYLFLFQHIKDYFAYGTNLRTYIIHIGISHIADMMVNAGSICRLFKQLACNAHSFFIRKVYRKKQVKSGILYFVFYFFKICQIG